MTVERTLEILNENRDPNRRPYTKQEAEEALQLARVLAKCVIDELRRPKPKYDINVSITLDSFLKCKHCAKIFQVGSCEPEGLCNACKKTDWVLVTEDDPRKPVYFNHRGEEEYPKWLRKREERRGKD